MQQNFDIIGADASVTAYEHDALNRLSSTTDPGNGVWLVGCDPAGNVVSRTDANNHVMRVGYES